MSVFTNETSAFILQRITANGFITAIQTMLCTITDYLKGNAYTIFITFELIFCAFGNLMMCHIIFTIFLVIFAGTIVMAITSYAWRYACAIIALIPVRCITTWNFDPVSENRSILINSLCECTHCNFLRRNDLHSRSFCYTLALSWYIFCWSGIRNLCHLHIVVLAPV